MTREQMGMLFRLIRLEAKIAASRAFSRSAEVPELEGMCEVLQMDLLDTAEGRPGERFRDLDDLLEEG